MHCYSALLLHITPHHHITSHHTTPHHITPQLKNQGKAPIALRWSRLKERYESHRRCVDDVVGVLQQEGCQHNVISR